LEGPRERGRVGLVRKKGGAKGGKMGRGGRKRLFREGAGGQGKDGEGVKFLKSMRNKWRG